MIQKITSIPIFIIKFLLKIIKSGLNERNLFTFPLNFFINFLPISIWLTIFKNAGILPNEIRPKIYVSLIYNLDLQIFKPTFINIFIWCLITLGFTYLWYLIIQKKSFHYNLNINTNSILPKIPDEEEQSYEFENFQDSDEPSTSSSSTDSLPNFHSSSLSISPKKITRFHSLYLTPIIFFSVWPMLNIVEHFAQHITVPKDLTAWFFYVLGHITFPILTAVYLYVFHPPGILKCFSIALGLQNIAGVLTHLLFPNAPPWFIHLYGPDSDANYDMPGYAAGLTRIDVTLGTHLHSQGFHKSPIVFGAFPSLHSAMAVQVFLFIWYFANFKILRIAALGFVYIQWWGTIYLDHHFKIDLIAGWGYALISFAIVYPYLRKKELEFIQNRLNLNFKKGSTMGMRVFDRNSKIQKFFDPYR
ncbi:Inositolphosphotransferase 1 [Wickerhamomyces ciferrii]|uniref:Inositolphosphotransferase 1 n=1 Tax=Wickerhamomyces ciferrii (strain ATCC 14091 / BCRC 22168 / CBS 111 / JCM 3599 / NBRC 0793 / NRRL Y-1031 F-60-10) TaxID=1206466 RepID=K0KF69_WICCF|nr:Inositolphosphotransferase 1 [Wickerhamomyces ciferrii]CCH41606.1 Inositolphosphotransferase 1 [Wickerhamomyces ciferrii]